MVCLKKQILTQFLQLKILIFLALEKVRKTPLLEKLLILVIRNQFLILKHYFEFSNID